MRFGTKASEAPAGGGGGDYIKYPKKGDNVLRFLEELDDWTIYWEHFNQDPKGSYPCTGDRKTCPGCVAKDADESGKTWGAGKKYLVNALSVEDGYVDLWKIPSSVIDDMIRWADADGGTITSRDYTVIKYTNKDDKIKYSAERGDKEPMDLSLYEDKKKDHQVALASAYAEIWGEVPDDAPEEKPVRKPVAKKAAAKSVAAAVREAEKDAGYPDPPTEPASATPEETQGTDSDDLVLSETELRHMTIDQVKALYSQCGFDVPDEGNVDELVDNLIELLG